MVKDVELKSIKVWCECEWFEMKGDWFIVSGMHENGNKDEVRVLWDDIKELLDGKLEQIHTYNFTGNRRDNHLRFLDDGFLMTTKPTSILNRERLVHAMNRIQRLIEVSSTMDTIDDMCGYGEPVGEPLCGMAQETTQSDPEEHTVRQDDLTDWERDVLRKVNKGIRAAAQALERWKRA